MKKLFGTDGMRGEAGEFPLDAPTIRTVGDSLARHLQAKLGRRPLIVIGRDTRESGDWLEQALIAGAVRAGAQSKSAGVITTPGIAFLTRALPADAGVVISASHNAYRDNGIKIFAPSGRKLDEETERLIESDVFAAREQLSAGSERQPATGAHIGPSADPSDGSIPRHAISTSSRTKSVRQYRSRVSASCSIVRTARPRPSRPNCSQG